MQDSGFYITLHLKINASATMTTTPVNTTDCEPAHFKIDKDIFGIIASRHSSRTFSGLALSSSVKEQLWYAASGKLSPMLMPLFPDGTPYPSIRFIEMKGNSTPPSTYGVVKGARLYATMGVDDPMSRPQRVLAGAVFERFILDATRFGLSTCWLGGTFSRSAFQTCYEAEHGVGTVVIVSPVGHEAPKQRFGEKLMRAFVHASSRKPFESLFQGIKAPEEFPPITHPMVDDNIMTAMSVMLEAMRRAPSASNSQPWRAKVRRIDGISGEICLSCPNPGGHFAPNDMGIALCHLALSAEALGLNIIPGTADFKNLVFNLGITCLQ